MQIGRSTWQIEKVSNSASVCSGAGTDAIFDWTWLGAVPNTLLFIDRSLHFSQFKRTTPSILVYWIAEWRQWLATKSFDWYSFVENFLLNKYFTLATNIQSICMAALTHFMTLSFAENIIWIGIYFWISCRVVARKT